MHRFVFVAFIWSSCGLLLSIGAVGCDEPPVDGRGDGSEKGGGSVERQVCERSDECNVLEGQSTEECIDDWTDYLGEMSSAGRNDCEAQIRTCLEKESCENFLGCEISDCP